MWPVMLIFQFRSWCRTMRKIGIHRYFGMFYNMGYTWRRKKNFYGRFWTNKNCREGFSALNPLVETKNLSCLLPSTIWFSKGPPRNLLETYLKIFSFTYGYVPRSSLHDGESPTSLAVCVLELFGSQSLAFYFEINSRILIFCLLIFYFAEKKSKQERKSLTFSISYALVRYDYYF